VEKRQQTGSLSYWAKWRRVKKGRKGAARKGGRQLKGLKKGGLKPVNTKKEKNAWQVGWQYGDVGVQGKKKKRTRHVPWTAGLEAQNDARWGPDWGWGKTPSALDKQR